jgi:nucleotidyltransferase substrate binding protein (TIGR01987 family)
MMSTEHKDMSWEQHFLAYRKALVKLTVAINIFKPEEDEDNFELEEVDELLKEGLIHRFEYTYIMACNTMKAYTEFQDNKSVSGHANVIRESGRKGLIADAEAWLEMEKTTGLTAHTYAESNTEDIFEKLIDSFYALFLAFEAKMMTLRTGK